MMHVAERLRAAMEARRIKQSELSEITGIGKSSISTYLSGSYEPKQRNIYKMAKALDVNEAWLMGEDVPMQKEAASLLSNILPMPQTYKVPLLGTIACGAPILAVEECEETADVPLWVKADFALRCKGDSMITARIFDGDVVYIKAQPVVNNGEIAAVRVGDEATLKKVYLYDKARIVLRAANPTFPDLEFEGEQLNEVEILGKAVAFTGMVK